LSKEPVPKLNIYDRYSMFVKRNRRKLLLLIIIVNIISFLGLIRIHISTNFDVFMPKKSYEKNLYDRMNKTFQSGEQLMIMVEFENNVLSVEGLKELLKISDSIKMIKGVKSVISPLPEKVPIGFKLLDVKEVSSKNIDKVIKFVMDMKETVNIKEKDGKYYAMYIVIPEDHENVMNITKGLKKELKSYKFYISGNSYLESKIFDYILLIIFILPPTAFFLIVNVFKWQIGNFKATIFSVMPAGMAALWTMGILGWTGKDLSVVTVLVPIFTIVMGSADGLHFVSHFLENKQNGLPNTKSLSITLSSVGRAMIMTTLTTMAGFISLTTINSQSMVQMGFFASIGIGLAAVATWFVLPVVLIESGEFKFKKTSLNISSFFEKLSNKKALIISSLIVILFIPGLFNLNANFNVLKMYKSYTEVRKNVEKIQEVFGSALPVFLAYNHNNIFEPEIANDILDLQKQLLKTGNVQKIISIYDIISLVNEHLYGQKGYPQQIPRILLIKRLLPQEQLLSFVDSEGKNGRSMIFLKDLENNTLNSLKQIVDSHRKIEKDLYLAGTPFVIKEMNDSIISQQFKSLTLALILVFVLLLLSQRNFITPLFSIIPISITLIGLFGFMGYSGMDLNIVTITMASIVIGVGIDYSIHFVELFKYYSKMGKNNPLEKTFKSASKPILANALGLAIGLTAMFLSPLTIHSYLAGIMWVTMIISSFVSLTLLPFLIKVWYSKHQKIK